MGNLCSSGTDQADKREENRVPDKPRDGEDEVLLPKAEAEVEAALQASALGGGGGGDGGGGCALVGGAVKSVESGFAELGRSAQEEGQRVTENFVQAGKEEVARQVEDVQTSATSAAAEAAVSVRAAGEQAVAHGVESAERKVAEISQSVAERIEDVVVRGQNQVVAAVGGLGSGVTNVAAVGGLESGVTNVAAVGSLESGVTNVAAVGSLESGVTNVAAVGNLESGVTNVAAVGSLESGVTNVAAVGNLESEVTNVAAVGSLESGVTSVAAVGSLKSGVTSVADGAENAENLKGRADVSAISTAGDAGFTVGFIGQVVGKKVEEVKSSAAYEAESIRQTAENAANEAVESARLSTSEAVGTWAEGLSQNVGSLAANVGRASQALTESTLAQQSALEENAKTSSEQAQEEVADRFRSSEISAEEIGQSGVDEPQIGQDFVRNVEQSVQEGIQNASDYFTSSKAGLQQSGREQLDNLQAFAGHVTQGAADSAGTAQASVEQELEATVSQVQEAAATAGVEAARLGSEATEYSSSVQDAATAGAVEAVEAVSAVRDIQASEPQQKNFEEPNSPGTVDEPSSQNQKSESVGLFGDVVSAAREAVQSGVEYVKELVQEKTESSAGEGRVPELEGEDVDQEVTSTTQEPEQKSPATDEDFIEKAKSLLESHRSSVDGSRVTFSSVSFAETDVPESSDKLSPAVMSESESQEATARDFVEAIIEKATSLVAESQERKEPASEDSSLSDPGVDRGEENLAPKKRGVMFVSPQISERSSSSLSSPQEMSPPPPHESDLSPPGESTSSSISQGDLVETEELLHPLSSSAEFLVHENNNNNNIINNNAEDDDESIQRIAMEVTAKAVQDAIKIVTENGSGSVLVSENILSNDVGASSPSSPDNDEDDMTTTDSSQVERGSPVSDLTDTSAHGSVSESLSSYDPGAVFRQDIANLTDLTMSPAEGSSAVDPPAQRAHEASKAAEKLADAVNFEGGSPTHVETPTPTNAVTFDSYTHPAPHPASDDHQKPDITPPQSFPSEVPLPLLPFDESSSSSSSNKPTIVINSPDSAHHTGSTEDMSTSQTEALI